MRRRNNGEDDEFLSDKSVKSQCYSNTVELEGDRLDNPVWSVGDQTLSQCKAMCSTERDAFGRPCVAIEYKDGGQNLPASEKRNCNMAWACDFTESWSDGSVYSGDASSGSMSQVSKPEDLLMDWKKKLERFDEEMALINSVGDIIEYSTQYNLISKDKDWRADVMSADSFMEIDYDGLKTQFVDAIMTRYWTQTGMTTFFRMSISILTL